MRINLNEKELAMLVHLIWQWKSKGELITNYSNKGEEGIKVFLGNPDGSDDYWLPTTQEEFYALADKFSDYLEEKFRKNKGEK